MADDGKINTVISLDSAAFMKETERVVQDTMAKARRIEAVQKLMGAEQAARQEKSKSWLQKGMGSIGSMVGGLTAFSAMQTAIAVVREQLEKALEFANVINDTVDNLKVGSGFVQKFSGYMKEFGVSSEESTGMMYKFNDAIGDAAKDSNSEAAKTFAKLGVSIRDASGEVRSMEDVMPEFQNALSGIESPAERQAAVLMAFGKAGRGAIDGLSQSFENLKEKQSKVTLLDDGQLQALDRVKKAKDLAMGQTSARLAGMMGNLVNFVTDPMALIGIKGITGQDNSVAGMNKRIADNIAKSEAKDAREAAYKATRGSFLTDLTSITASPDMPKMEATRKKLTEDLAKYHKEVKGMYEAGASEAEYGKKRAELAPKILATQNAIAENDREYIKSQRDLTKNVNKWVKDQAEVFTKNKREHDRHLDDLKESNRLSERAAKKENLSSTLERDKLLSKAKDLGVGTGNAGYGSALKDKTVAELDGMLETMRNTLPESERWKILDDERYQTLQSLRDVQEKLLETATAKTRTEQKQLQEDEAYKEQLAKSKETSLEQAMEFAKTAKENGLSLGGTRLANYADRLAQASMTRENSYGTDKQLLEQRGTNKLLEVVATATTQLAEATKE
jgi:hypothetical protein